MKLPLPVGASAALAAALLFGASTPLAKMLLAHTDPWLLAALLYLGSGIGLWLLRRGRHAPAVRLPPGERVWLAGAVASGGVLGPVLLLFGLSGMPAAGAALLLNLESVFTALLAWFVFRENFDRRIAMGLLAIVAGTIVLSWPGPGTWAVGGWRALWPALAVIGACLAWGLDNNLTRKVSLVDASYIAMVKGLMAGATNLALALLLGSPWPGAVVVWAAGTLGFVAYGASLVLFVLGLRHLGAARTGAYFSVAPFFGALLALGLLGESPTLQFLLAGALMAVGVALHLSERHAHRHSHDPVDHDHLHAHDAADLHHDHSHDPPVAPGTRHSHRHRHPASMHSHPHFPDAHHQHRH